MIPVRLCDLSPAVLQAAARRCARKESDRAAALDLLAAALRPSERVYWISEKAARQLPFLTADGSDTLSERPETGVCFTRPTLPTDPEFPEAA